MLDLNWFRNNLDAAADRLALRPYFIDKEQFRVLDVERRAAVTESEQLKAERNAASMEIGALKKTGADTSQAQSKVRAMGERAREVRLIQQSIQRVDRNRTSRATGATHPIGGFVGEAMYEGDLGEFLPYLEAGFWTGVGRQTVWGKGEIRTTVLAHP